MRVLSSEEMRRVDRYATSKIGIPGAVLMESAGRSVYAEIVRRTGSVQGKRVGIVAGTGNNGGDGFVVARYLLLNGAEVDLFVVGSSKFKPGEAKLNFQILEKMKLSATWIRSPKDAAKITSAAQHWDLAVDALFGTGLNRPLSELYRSVIGAINRAAKPVYAIDVPSGINADTGETMGGAVLAAVTVTLGFKKRGFFLNSAPEFCGDVVVADISLGDAWADKIGASPFFETDAAEMQSWFPKRKTTAHKGSNGHLLVIAGSPEKSGAAILTSRAALRAGAGLVTLAVPVSAHAIVKSQLVEVMSEPIQDDAGKLTERCFSQILELCAGKQAVVVGPGLIPHPGLKRLLERLFRAIRIPIILDADGLNVFGKDLKKLGSSLTHMILTPHPGEMARLTGKSTQDVQKNRIEIAQTYSEQTGAIVVLKGAYTIVTLPEGETRVNPTGNPGMATAGMGDVLAGVIGAYVAQGLTLPQAAVAGAFYHGLAGDRVAAKKGTRGLLASDVIDELPQLSI